MNDDEGKSETRDRFSAITDKSYVQIGAVAGVLSAAIAFACWATALSGKVDQVIDEVRGSRTITAKVNDNETKIKILELRMAQFEECSHRK